MAGDLTNLASGRARPQRIRPHWWAVLAVSLSLLALVAAATSDHSNGRGDKTASRDGQTARHAPTSPPTSSPTTTTTSPTTPPSAVTPTTSAPTVASVNAASTTRVVTKASITAPATTTTTTAPATTAPATTTTAPATRGSAIGAAAQPAPQTLTGDLQQPDDASANYAFTGSGAMRISVSWSPTTTLSLFVSCPDGSQSAEGASSASIVLPDADGACELTLKETLVQYNAVSYTLTIAPAGG